MAPRYASTIADGDDLTDSINRLQAVIVSATSDANGDVSVTFPNAYASAPIVVATRKTTSNNQCSIHIHSITATTCKFTITNNNALRISLSSNFGYFAMGDLA